VALSDLLSRKEIAHILGVDERSITNYAKEGIPRSVKGRVIRYPLAPCVQWFVEFRVRQHEMGKGPSELDLAKQRKTSADARLAELEVAEKEGELIPIDVALGAFSHLLEEFRARTMAATGRLSQVTVGLMTSAETAAAIEPVMDELLEVLSRTPMPMIEPPAADADAA